MYLREVIVEKQNCWTCGNNFKWRTKHLYG